MHWLYLAELRVSAVASSEYSVASSPLTRQSTFFSTLLLWQEGFIWEKALHQNGYSLPAADNSLFFKFCSVSFFPIFAPAGLARPAPAELPQDRKVARVGGCSGAM